VTEELRPIPGYDGSYSITRDGRVWSHPKAPPAGKRGRNHGGRWLAASLCRRDGARFVKLSKDGEKYQPRVSTLVRNVWGDA
jgi:hypothetical protein